MKIEQILSSKSVLLSFAIVILVSIVLAFFPLIGVLGFEFSAIIGLLLSFASVYISAALISLQENKERFKRNPFDLIGIILFINFLLLLFPFAIGLISSLIKDDCFIKEGTIFYLLIPAVSALFSAAIGMLWGYFLGRKGIIFGLLTIFFIAIYSLWKLYFGISIFVYNPIFGFFPGPLYDEAIPITLTLIISRIYVALWALLFLLLLRFLYGLSRSSIGLWNTVLIVAVGIAIAVVAFNEPKLGISYTREYITKNILSGTVETENFIIYFAPGTPEAEKIEIIANDHEWRYKQLKEYLEVDSPKKIRSYLYPDIETRKKIIGAGETTIANPIHGEIHLIYDTFPHPILKHELVHVMSGEFGNDILKISPKIGLLEGIAVAADWRGHRFTPHQWAKVMREMQIAPGISEIVGFGFWYAPSEISYVLMGSFSRYLIDTYGIEKYKEAYKTGNFSSYDKSIEELSTEWAEYLLGIETPPETKTLAEARFSRPSIFQATCPRKIAGLKHRAYEHFEDHDYYQAKEEITDALKLNNSDPELITWLAYAHYYGGNYSRASEIADSSASGSIYEKNILRNLKGNSLWQIGDSEQAIGIFRDLNQEQIADNLGRELDIKTSSISQSEGLEENIKKFFGTRDEVMQLAYLQDAIDENPSYAPAYYLRGRLFFNEGEFEKAVPNLIEANLLGLPTSRLTNENLRILGVSQFAMGDYNQATVTFNYLIAIEENRAAKRYAQDFIERAAWMIENQESIMR